MSQKKRGQDGSIIVVAVVLLMLVTLMGISITQITSIEIQVAGNERDYKQVFYLAEAAMMEALQRMESALAEDLKPSTTTLMWMHTPNTDLEDKPTMADTSVSAASSTDPATARFAATARGITGGSSLAMTTTSQLYSFEVYGYAAARGKALIAGGYRRRF